MSGERGRSGGDMPGLSHQRAEELISNQLDGPLDAASQRALSAHLAGCASCGYFAAQIGVMGDGLRELPRLPASPTVARQVRERIQQPATLWDRLGGLFSGQLGVAPVAATAALLVAVAAGAILLNGDGGGTADDNPTVLASTQISIDRTLTSTRAAGEPSATAVPGRVLDTPTPEQTPLPNIRFEPSATPTETPAPDATETNVPEPTETPASIAIETLTPTPEPAATDVPTDTPTEIPPTETATEEPTEVPTATDVPPSETSTVVPDTETPTQEPAEPTDVPTEEPTEEPTEVPTETPTEEPTQEPDTATPEPEPTEEPQGAPTIGPIDGDPVDPIDGETPVEQPTDEPVVDEPTETPVDGIGNGGDTELTIEPVGTTVTGDDPIQTPEGGTGGPIDESATEEITIDETPVDPIETPEDEVETPDDGAGAVLDETSRIAPLPEGAGAPIGQLSFSPDQTLMVVSNAGGQSLQIADIASGGIVQDLGPGQYPEWSPLSGILLFNDLDEGGTVNAWFRDGNDFFSVSGSDVEDGGYADVPAGWFDATAYYLRIYDSGRISLRAYDAAIGETVGEIWGSDDVELAGVRPLQTNGGFLIPTANSWLLVTPDGGVQEVGGNSLEFAGDGLVSPDGSQLAISTGTSLAIVDAGAPGNVVAELPYSESEGAGFSWSPDSQYIAISDNISISVYTADGSPVGAATSETGVTIAGPQFQADGIYFVQTSGEPSLRRFDLNRLLS